MHPSPVDQEALKARILPQMTLGDGSSSSVTAPPQSTPHHTSNKERAKHRFAVNGNAIVTGGAGALGLQASRALLEHGLSGLMIFDLDPGRIQSALTELTSDFPAASIGARMVDVTSATILDEAVAETVEVLGSVDMLLCFAGVVLCAHSLDVTAAEWRKVLEINTTGSFLTAQAVARVMIKQGTGGSILFTASISGHRVNYPQPQVAYNVSKAALLTMKDCLAAEWARYGIRCNSISPGYIDTILNEGPGLVEARDIWNSRNPMGRMGLPSELTGSVVLLCSNAGSYINGVDIVVDGGAIVF